jgi:hypothetical protein
MNRTGRWQSNADIGLELARRAGSVPKRMFANPAALASNFSAFDLRERLAK